MSVNSSAVFGTKDTLDDFIHSHLHVFLPFVSQLDTPIIISPQLLMFLLVYVIIYKLTLWNMNT